MKDDQVVCQKPNNGEYYLRPASWAEDQNKFSAVEAITLITIIIFFISMAIRGG